MRLTYDPASLKPYFKVTIAGTGAPPYGGDPAVFVDYIHVKSANNKRFSSAYSARLEGRTVNALAPSS